MSKPEFGATTVAMRPTDIDTIIHGSAPVSLLRLRVLREPGLRRRPSLPRPSLVSRCVHGPRLFICLQAGDSARRRVAHVHGAVHDVR